MDWASQRSSITFFGGSDKVEGVVDHHVYCTSAKMRKVVVDGTFGKTSRMWHSHARKEEAKQDFR